MQLLLVTSMRNTHANYMKTYDLPIGYWSKNLPLVSPSLGSVIGSLPLAILPAAARKVRLTFNVLDLFHLSFACSQLLRVKPNRLLLNTTTPPFRTQTIGLAFPDCKLPNPY